MLFRSLNRAFPRFLTQSFGSLNARSFSTVRRTSAIQQVLKSAPIPRCATFSTSRVVYAMEGNVDQELSAKIESELQMEKEMRDSEKLPASITDYLDSSSFELHDTPGQEEVFLTRKFGDETIRVSFSIADLNNIDPDQDTYNANEEDDNALYDEDLQQQQQQQQRPSNIPQSAQSGGANSKNTINQGKTADGNINVAPEDRIAPADREELADGESGSPPPATGAAAAAAEEGGRNPSSEPSFPARLTVAIEKGGRAGTLQIEATAQDGEVVIDNVCYFQDGELADAKTAELDWKRRNLYEGPPFGNLDEDLQVLLERYLDERGVNTALAVWVPEYIDFKEQREYLGWLSNVKAFVDA